MPDGEIHLADALRLPRTAVQQKFAVFGQSGSGKSYTAMKLAEGMLDIGAQIVVLDPVGVWWGLRASADGRGPGYPITVFGGDHGDLPLPVGAAALVGQLLAERPAAAILDVSGFELPDQKRFVRDFAGSFFQAKKRNKSPVHLFMEEAQVLAPMNPQSDETTMLNRIELVARIGRNYGIGWTIISQRPQDVHTKVRGQAGTMIAMRTMGTHERKAIAEWANDKARNKEEASLVERLMDLPDGTGIVMSPSFLKISATVAFAARATFDSSATPDFDAGQTEPTTLAPVDVAALREALAAATEEAEANNPAALKRRITELERRLRERPQSAPPAPERILERVEVPTVPDGIRQAARRLRAEIDGLYHEIAFAPEAPSATQGPGPPATVPTPVVAVETPIRARPAKSAARPTTARAVGLPGPQRRILDTLATFAALGLSVVARGHVAVMSGQSPKSSSFTNHLGALRTAGLIDYPQGGTVALTDEGRATGAAWDRILSATTVQESWIEMLGSGPQGRILRALLARYPETIDRAALATEAEQSPKSSSFTNHLGRLRSLGLIAYPADGYVVATVFFAEPTRG